MWGSQDMSKSPATIVTGPKNANFKESSTWNINVAHSPKIKRKSQVDATKTFLISEKHCFEKDAFKV